MTARSGRARRPAFSLVEVLVVAGVLLAVVAGGVLYQVSGQRQSLALDFRAASLQSAQLVIARLQRDVAGMVPGPLVRTFAEPTACREVTLTRTSDRSDPRGLPLDAREALLTETVRWRFDPASHLLSRNGEPVRAVRMESVEFTYFPCRPGDTTPPYGDTLVVRMVAVPPEALGRVSPRTPRAVYTARFHSPQGTINHLHEDWVGER
ncbi:MAG: hypothetical protein HY815_22250 [Candidatus Riflebacteria bacterium]|nr:hypothetical protein [Candidatus Riflebacteria bacterium]